jgi:hypothetical protein
MPANTVGRLLLAAKLREGAEWKQLERELGILKGTREFWLNGRVTRLPLIPVHRLAAALKISGRDLMRAAVHDELPPWALRELAAWEEEE